MSIKMINSVVDTSINKVVSISASNVKIFGQQIVTGVAYNKFYFPSTGSPTVSPSYSSPWTNTSSAIRRRLVTSRNGTSSNTATSDYETSHYYTLLVQYVSSALIAQTVAAGYVEGQIKGYAMGTHSNLCFAVKICNSSGTITQTIISATSSKTLPNGSYINRQFKSGSDTTVNFSSFTTNSGDRLIVELGAYTTLDTTSITIGTDSGSDLPQDETSTSAYNPWINFSQSIYLSA